MQRISTVYIIKFLKNRGESNRQIYITFLDTLKGRFEEQFIFECFRINTEQFCKEDLTSHQT